MYMTQRIAQFKIDLETSKETVVNMVKYYLQNVIPNEDLTLVEKFIKNYNQALLVHEKEDQTDLARLYRLITEFKPVLSTILPLGKTYDGLCDIMVQQFNLILDRIRRQINEKHPKQQKSKNGMLNRMESPPLKFFCTICKETFAIPTEIQKQILNSDEKITLPRHHDKEMVVKIGNSELESNKQAEESLSENKIDVYPAELLMQHLNSAESRAEYLKLLSVGIDVGSSTSLLNFSRITLKREQNFFNITNRFNMVEKELLYQGNIIFTPLLDSNTIDIDAVVKFFECEYQKAGITPEQVDTGAVIVTGESAKKNNAAEIVQRLSSKSGKFVSATAGPNFEAVLGAMGSGIVDYSKRVRKTILNVDVGGGSSKLAIVSNGNILTTSSINVGGRLLGINKEFKIWRVDPPAEILMRDLGMSYHIGEIIAKNDLDRLVSNFAQTLLEVMLGPATSTAAKSLMMTNNLDFSVPVAEYSFSGGVGELIYQIKNNSVLFTDLATNNESGVGSNTYEFNDIGWLLAKELVRLIESKNLSVHEPENKIRATVIGAGAFSLSVSGSTCFYDPSISLPLQNIPVVAINLDFKKILFDDLDKMNKFRDHISQSLNNFNLSEGEDIFALYFNDITIRGNFNLFVKFLRTSLPNSIANQKLIIIILGFDGAKILGLTLEKELGRKRNLFCLDELMLESGDWIDIGLPIGDQGKNQAFPITIKSLLFNKKNQINQYDAIDINNPMQTSNALPTQSQSTFHRPPTKPPSQVPTKLPLNLKQPPLPVNNQPVPIKKSPSLPFNPPSTNTTHQTSKLTYISPDLLKLVSVGIDVGSSTSHLVFSRLTMRREKNYQNMTNRFVLVNREKIYDGNIIFTPLIDPTTIDIENLIAFFESEYENAHMTPDQIDTGAVIVTGETAKKQNAAEIVRRLASQSGKFVSAAAGPNFESVLAIMGSGMVDLSRKKNTTILNVDIGGGSTKLAIASKGHIYSTSSINVGARILGIEKDYKIWRIDEPARVVMDELNIHDQIGEIISESDVHAIAHCLAKTLIEVMQGKAKSKLAKSLMMTNDLDFSIPIEEISFSGGVSELIYNILNLPHSGQFPLIDQDLIPYNDIGWFLAEEIVNLLKVQNMRIIEPDQKIRATVIGAGSLSLSISGSTCYYDSKIPLPLNNVPVVCINMDFKNIALWDQDQLLKVRDNIALSLNNYNLIEGMDTFALFFNDINIRANLKFFSKALEYSLPNSIKNKTLVIIILGFDGARMLGVTLKSETALKENIFCLDELFLEPGDWLDIGKPIQDGQIFPITIKSLVFNQTTQK